MPQLTDAQKVMRNDTGQDIAEQIRLLRLQMESGGLPAGGAVGMIPVKTSAADYVMNWQYPQYSRPNLLDNWYFVGGGSQLGDGVFPINQRGQTVYTTSQAFTIDRWVGRFASGASLTLTGNGIVLAGPSGIRQIIQSIKDKDSLKGRTITITIKVAELEGSAAITLGDATVNYEIGTIIDQLYFDSPGLWSLTTVVPDTLTGNYLNLVIGLSGATSMTVEAVKLEIGSYQTLAHEENGDWVLNELPDYGEELVKCNLADGKTVEYTDRFLVLESTYEYARDLTWTAIGGGIAYSAKMKFTYNGETNTTVPGYRAVAATIARFSSYRPDYQWVPYIQYNTGEVCIYSAVGANTTDFIASSHISVRAIFEKI